MLNKSKLIVAVACLLMMNIAVGCVSQTEFETLQIERRRDDQRIMQLKAELEESKRLLKEEIENSQNPVRQRTADMWSEIQTLKTEIARLRGDIDLLGIRMDRQVGEADSPTTMTTLKKQLDEIEFVLETQLQVDLSKIRTAPTPSASTNSVQQPNETPVSSNETKPTSPVVTAPVKEKTQQPAANTDPAKALYDKAYALYRDGNYEKARAYWAEFSDTFKGHSFSASAVFWQGQCYYKLKDYARAAILFEDVIEKHKKSSKYKSALLKAGYSWSYLAKPELAKMRMEEVIQSFPKSVEATQAKRFLEKRK